MFSQQKSALSFMRFLLMFSIVLVTVNNFFLVFLYLFSIYKHSACIYVYIPEEVTISHYMMVLSHHVVAGN